MIFTFVGVGPTMVGVTVDVPAPTIAAAWANLLRNSYLHDKGDLAIRRLYAASGSRSGGSGAA